MNNGWSLSFWMRICRYVSSKAASTYDTWSHAGRGVGVMVYVDVGDGVSLGVNVAEGVNVGSGVSLGNGVLLGVWVGNASCGGMFTTRVERNDSLIITRRACSWT